MPQHKGREKAEEAQEDTFGGIRCLAFLFLEVISYITSF